MRHFLLAAGLSLAATSSAHTADPIEGDWLTQGGSGKVRIAPCPGRSERLCGTLFWVKNPADAQALDSNNPDARLKIRPILGLPMIRDFKSQTAGRWAGGKIYDPDSGKTYDSKLSVNGNGTLKVEGCILMICRAQTWRRG